MKRDINSAPNATQKKPYKAPAIIYREPLEAVASVCSPPGKADLGSCPTGPISS